jgi:hypothetical protein
MQQMTSPVTASGNFRLAFDNYTQLQRTILLKSCFSGHAFSFLIHFEFTPGLHHLGPYRAASEIQAAWSASSTLANRSINRKRFFELTEAFHSSMILAFSSRSSSVIPAYIPLVVIAFSSDRRIAFYANPNPHALAARSHSAR